MSDRDDDPRFDLVDGLRRVQAVAAAGDVFEDDDFDGHVIQIELTPEEALAVIEDDDLAERIAAAVDAVLAARRAC